MEPVKSYSNAVWLLLLFVFVLQTISICMYLYFLSTVSTTSKSDWKYSKNKELQNSVSINRERRTGNRNKVTVSWTQHAPELVRSSSITVRCASISIFNPGAWISSKYSLVLQKLSNPKLIFINWAGSRVICIMVMSVTGTKKPPILLSCSVK